MKRSVSLLAVCAMAGSLGIVGSVGAAPGNKYATETTVRECNDDGSHTISLVGPLKLWPPNHKYVSYSLTAAGHESDEVALAFEGTHDEFDEDGNEINGAGNTDMDVNPAMAMDEGTGSATVEFELRAERSGRGDGRLYTLMAEAEFSDDPANPCMETFEVNVPHDMRGGRDW